MFIVSTKQKRTFPIEVSHVTNVTFLHLDINEGNIHKLAKTSHLTYTQ